MRSPTEDIEFEWDLEIRELKVEDAEKGVAKKTLRVKRPGRELTILYEDLPFDERFLRAQEGREVVEMRIVLKVRENKKLELKLLKAGDVFRTEDANGEMKEWVFRKVGWTGVIYATLAESCFESCFMESFLPTKIVEWVKVGEEKHYEGQERGEEEEEEEEEE